MITLTRLDGTHLVINCDLIESMESTPDTVLTLVNQKHLVVREDVQEVMARIIEFKHKIFWRCTPE